MRAEKLAGSSNLYCFFEGQEEEQIKKPKKLAYEKEFWEGKMIPGEMEKININMAKYINKL